MERCANFSCQNSNFSHNNCFSISLLSVLCFYTFLFPQTSSSSNGYSQLLGGQKFYCSWRKNPTVVRTEHSFFIFGYPIPILECRILTLFWVETTSKFSPGCAHSISGLSLFTDVCQTKLSHCVALQFIHKWPITNKSSHFPSCCRCVCRSFHISGPFHFFLRSCSGITLNKSKFRISETGNK